MNWQLLLPLLVTSIVSVFGWFTLHQFARKRDIENKQKKLRINYLIEAWRKLDYSVNKNNYDPSEILENPIADIQLLGTTKQIELAKS